MNSFHFPNYESLQNQHDSYLIETGKKHNLCEANVIINYLIIHFLEKKL